MTHHRAPLVLFLVASAVRCGGADEAPTTPAPQAAGSEEASDQAAAPVPGRAVGNRPCDAYVAEAMRCARKEAAALDQPLPDAAEVLEGFLRENCRDWLRGGRTTGDLAAALESCGSVDCAAGSDAWGDCIDRHLPLPPPATTPAFGDPSTWSRIDPRPIDGALAPCDVMIEWLLACVRETLGDTDLPPEAVQALRDGYSQACVAWESTPEMKDALPHALRVCADVGCGEAGADVMICIATELATVMTGGVQGAPTPEPAPEPAPEPEP